MSERYEAIDAVNWSTLKLLRESPLHYRHAVISGREDSTMLAKGRAGHALVFEPDTFDLRYAVFDGARRAGKAWEAFESENFDKTILKRDEVDSLRRMADAVRSHPLVAPYFEGAKFERVVTWVDPPSELLCKCRYDWIQRETKTLLELKTTTTVDRFRFGRIAARLGYHSQLAHYAAACEHGLGWVPDKVVIVAAEVAPPHDVGVFYLDADARAAGRQEVDALLERLKGCRTTGRWPGRYLEEMPLQLPPYIYGDDADHDDAETLGITAAGPWDGDLSNF